eukprot:scaffold16334_cov97-Phaeocystis_antarctica.AAC.4
MRVLTTALLDPQAMKAELLALQHAHSTLHRIRRSQRHSVCAFDFQRLCATVMASPLPSLLKL